MGRPGVVLALVVLLALGVAFWGNSIMTVKLTSGAEGLRAKSAVEPATAVMPEHAVENQAPELLTHQVAQGESVSSIAAQYGTDTTTIVELNHLGSANLIRPGQNLKVLTVKGVVHTVSRGDTLSGIAQQHRVGVTAVTDANPQISSIALQVGAEVIVPDGKPVRRVATTASRGSASRSMVLSAKSASTAVNKAAVAGFRWPLRGTITSGFGPRWGRLHAGLDIAVPTGTPVKASLAGTVTYSGWASGYGKLVKVSHPGGYETRYAHNSQLLVQLGDTIEQGTLLAYSGNTGFSTGPHLHFEIRVNGSAIDPGPVLK